MKVLIAAACIAVLTFVGYYFWGEFRKTGEDRSRATIAANQKEYDQCLKALIDFKEGLATSPKDENKARQCATFMNDWHGLPKENEITVDSRWVNMAPLR